LLTFFLPPPSWNFSLYINLNLSFLSNLSIWQSLSLCLASLVLSLSISISNPPLSVFCYFISKVLSLALSPNPFSQSLSHSTYFPFLFVFVIVSVRIFLYPSLFLSLPYSLSPFLFHFVCLTLFFCIFVILLYSNGLSVLKIYSLPYLFRRDSRIEFHLSLSSLLTPYSKAKIKPSNESAFIQNNSGLANARLVWVSINDVTLTIYTSLNLKHPYLVIQKLHNQGWKEDLKIVTVRLSFFLAT